MFVSYVCSVHLRPLRRADHSFSGVLPAVCLCATVCDMPSSKLGGLGPIWAVTTQKIQELGNEKRVVEN
jgi:hypothetical protein